MFSSANLPYFGRVIFGTGALNLVLSLLFMKMGSLLGIAIATVAAQVALNCLLVMRLARHEGLHSSELFVRTLVQPLLFVLLLVALKLWWPMKDLPGQLSAVVAVISLVVIEFWLLGLRPAQVRAEYKILRGMLKSSPEEATTPAAQASA